MSPNQRRGKKINGDAQSDGEKPVLQACLPWLRGSAPHSTPISANRPPGYTEAGDFAPAMLRPLNLLWLRFGLLLHRVVNPIVMGLLFFAVFMPMGLLMRLSGKDFLRLRFRGGDTSYWITRVGSPPGSMRNQF